MADSFSDFSKELIKTSEREKTYFQNFYWENVKVQQGFIFPSNVSLIDIKQELKNQNIDYFFIIFLILFY